MPKFVRSKKNRWLLGVCAGLASWWQVDRRLVRLLFVLVSVCSAAFPGVLVYLILATVMPPGE